MARGRPIEGLSDVAERQIYDHCFESDAREVGGVLVGYDTARGPIVVASIRAEKADESLAALTFTQDSWAYIHRVRDRDYADFAIVGWYHSHPSHGIFLSDQDLFIHENFFSGENQIAYVVDPVAGQEGVFGWCEGEVVRWFRRPTSRRPLGHSRVSDSPRTRRRVARREQTSGAAGQREVRRPEAESAAQHRLAARSAEARLPLVVGVYLAIIGLAMGVCFWALLLR
jgi:proteasome lid subunit RPN8/RPN11